MVNGKEIGPVSPEIMPDMKLYFGEMHKVLRYQGYVLGLAGMSMGRSVIDMIRELLITSIEKIGINNNASDKIWCKTDTALYKDIKRKVDNRKIIPKSKLPEKYKELFQDIRTLYFWAEEKVKEKGVHLFSYENTPIGTPVELVAEMLDKIVDVNLAKTKWEEIKGDRNRISEFYGRTRWKVKDLGK
jgi:hypothetical protein